MSKHYTVTIKIADIKHAGGDDPFYCVLFGPEGSTEKLHMNNPGDDFKRGSTNSFTYDCDSFDVGDIGIPFAIGLIKTGSDAYQLTGDVEVRYFQFKNYEVKDIANLKFNAKDLVLGNKGDFGLSENRKEVTIYEGTGKMTPPIDVIFDDIVQQICFVIENRNGNTAYAAQYNLVVSASSSLLYSQSNSNRVQIKAKATAGGGIFSSDAKYSLEGTYETKFVTNNEQSFVSTVTESITLPINCKAGTLHFQKHNIFGRMNFEKINIGSLYQFNMRTEDVSPTLSAGGGINDDYLNGQDISDENKVLYQAIIGRPFEKNYNGEPVTNKKHFVGG